jgi:long-chain acyl-CoA synthetase
VAESGGQASAKMEELPPHPSSFDDDRMALVMFDSGESISYRDLNRRANQCARLYARLGCGPGDTIAILAENSIHYPELCWAAKNSGLHYACISFHLTEGEIAYILENSGARVLIVSDNLKAKIEGFPGTFPELNIVVLEGDNTDPRSYKTLRDNCDDSPLASCPSGASMLYSSGTTGFPKGVKATLDDTPATLAPRRLAGLIKQYEFDRDTVFVNPGPFYHTAPLRFMMSVHRLGGTVVGFRKFSAEGTLAAIERYGCTHGFFVPTMFVRLLALDDAVRRQYDLSSMRYAIHGAAPCTIAVKENMLAWWGPVLHELYGGTEGCGQTFITPEEWVRKKGSVGKPPAGCLVKILDENFNECSPNQPGLIYMGNGRTFEYHCDVEKTASVTGPDGLVTMGDIGYLDEDGYLFLTDRASDLIISGGVNIYPREVERVLEEMPEIGEVAVVGLASKEYGETVVAVVVPERTQLDHGQAALERTVLNYCRQRLSAVKCPRKVIFQTELPRTETGKVLKRKIKEQLEAGEG